MITATLAAISPPHTDVQVSSWTATNIAEFFRQEAGVEVAVGAIRRAKLRGERLFDGALDDTALAQLGITHEAEQVQIHRALDELGARLTDTPGSTWDWRLVNRRLCDWWVMPLASYAPEVLLVWSRYHSEPSGALGMLDDELDQAGPLWFWTTLMCVPSYPLFRLGSAHPISGLAGTVLHFTLFVRIVCEVCLARTTLHARGSGASLTLCDLSDPARRAGAWPRLLCHDRGQTPTEGALGDDRCPPCLLRPLLDAPRPVRRVLDPHQCVRPHTRLSCSAPHELDEGSGAGLSL